MARGSGKIQKAPREMTRAVQSEGGHRLRREVSGIVLLALAFFVGLSIASMQFGAGTLMGPFGAFVGTCAYGVLGIGAYLASIALGVMAVRMLRSQSARPSVGQLIAGTFGATFTAVLLHLATGSYRLRGYSTGGLVGEYGAELMVALLGTAGTVLFTVTGLLLSAVLTTSLRAASIGRVLAEAGRFAWSGFSRASIAAFPPHEEPDEDETPAPTPPPPVISSSLPATRKTLIAPILAHGTAVPRAVPEEATVAAVADKPRRRRKADMDQTAAIETTSAAALFAASQQIATPAILTGSALGAVAPVAGTEPTDPMPVAPAERKRRGPGAAPANALEVAATEPSAAPSATEAERTEAQIAPPEPTPTIVAPPRVRPAPAERPADPAPAGPRAPAEYIRLGGGEFRLPEIDVLDYQEAGHGEMDRQAMLDLAGRLERTLADYGVKGRVSEIHPGPVVTMYEFVPQAGTKLSKITSLSNDLAMALEALKVRIVAPIPGKAAVGIEVPNRVRETVYLKEIIGSESFARGKSKLTMALGKDIVGMPVCVDLAKMPHLLIAGTTGSGKSVSVNAMICSLLFNATPDEVKLIMIDPKMLELSIYEGIPHLLLPVVTDPKKANLALRWAVEEMERRYDLISKAGVRDIASYNKKVEKQQESALPAAAPSKDPGSMLITPRPIRIWIKDDAGQPREVECEASEAAVLAAGGTVTDEIREEISGAIAAAHKEAQQLEAQLAQEPPTKLPYIVIVIDEFADLMMVASKEVEQSVARIAQKARAAGIHLMLATQRPSVDVITGLIKANFPSRIAFQVASRIDSRTILDQQGAESLLGMGDMLFTDRGLAVKRVHGPLVTDGEIHKIVDFLKAQGQPVYDLDILKPRAEDEGGEEGGGEEYNDEMYDQAVMIVAEMRHASTSMLQRRLRLGYNRAARIIERMEREGIVGPADGARPREVLIHSHAA